MAHYTPIPGEGDYDYDLVLLFPYRTASITGGQPNKRKHVNRMLGLRSETIRGEHGTERIEFVDEARRYLHTDRCFMNFDGSPNAALAQAAEIIAEAKSEKDREGATIKQKDAL